MCDYSISSDAGQLKLLALVHQGTYHILVSITYVWVCDNQNNVCVQSIKGEHTKSSCIWMIWEKSILLLIRCENGTSSFFETCKFKIIWHLFWNMWSLLPNISKQKIVYLFFEMMRICMIKMLTQSDKLWMYNGWQVSFAFLINVIGQ